MTWDKVIKILAGIGGAIAGLFGGMDVLLRVLVTVMVIDYLSGWIVAILGKSIKTESGHLDSRISWKGLLKKGMALLVVFLGAQLDQVVGHDMFRNMSVCFYIATEGLSILENLALAGVPFPSGFRQLLEQAREKHDKPPDTPEIHENLPDEEDENYY